ncbi:MAG: hypothetical protein AABM29_02800 [Actinomycetota bacterium]
MQGSLGIKQLKLTVLPEVEEAVERVATEQGWSKVDVLREAICVYVRMPNDLSPRGGYWSRGGGARPLTRSGDPE